MENKRGNVDLVMAGVFTLVLAGFLFVMGLIMMDELYIDTADTSVTVVNETLTTVTETGEIVSASSACAFHNFAAVIVTNATGGETIESANYTTTDRTGTVTAVSADIYNNTDWNITYTYEFGNSSACSSVNETLGGQGRFADYIDLIVLAIVIAAIISLLAVVLSIKRVK